MRAVIHANLSPHQQEFAGLMAAGLKRHGVAVSRGVFDEPQAADFAVVWGWHQRRIIEACQEAGMPLLVMERGHIHPRMEWTSLGWGGLAGRGRYPQAQDSGERFARHFGHLRRDWRIGGEYVLLLGQTPGDASLRGLNFTAWADRVRAKVVELGYPVRFRPHPNVQCTRPLDEDLAGAGMAITYNSTSGVECVLAGVPTVAMDAGAMAWPMAAHDVDAPASMKDRADWCARLAWTQWQREEIETGAAWGVVQDAMNGGPDAVWSAS
jgi:hypothetical protein